MSTVMRLAAASSHNPPDAVRSRVARGITISLVLIAVLAAACSAESGSLEEGARQEELATALLTEDDVRSAPEAPPDLEEVPPDRANLSEDSDPRGPCGAEVDALPVLDGAIAVFGRDEIVVVNIVLTETGGLAERLITATAHDLVPGCPAFTKDTQKLVFVDSAAGPLGKSIQRSRRRVFILRFRSLQAKTQQSIHIVRLCAEY